MLFYSDLSDHKYRHGTQIVRFSIAIDERGIRSYKTNDCWVETEVAHDMGHKPGSDLFYKKVGPPHGHQPNLGRSYIFVNDRLSDNEPFPTKR